MLEIIALLFFTASLIFIYFKSKKDIDYLTKTVDTAFSSLGETTRKFYETLAEVQMQHFKDSSKQMALLEKQTKSLTRSYEMFLKQLASKKEVPIPLASEHIERLESSTNSIEKSEEEEIPLADMPRIPLVEGVKFKFENEEQIFPVNVIPEESVKIPTEKEETVNVVK